MNKEPVECLIEALRSGEYTQTTGHLRWDDGFCAMGVGIDIADFGGTWERSYGGRWAYTINSRKPFEAYYGMSLSLVSTLISWNDCLGASFNEIADWLEDLLALEEAEKTSTQALEPALR